MNKQRVKRLLTLFLPFVLLAVLGACRSPTSSSHSSTATAKLTLQIGLNGKTLVPADSDYHSPTSYDITLSASGYSTVTKTGFIADSSGLVSITGLAATTYTITAYGNYGGSAIVSGTGSINLSSGSGSGTVTLYYITSGTGTGNAALTIDASAAATSGYTLSSASMTLDGTSVVLSSSGTSAYTYSGTALALGSHTICITVTSGQESALISETLLILQGLTTTATITLAASDFSVNSLSMVDVTGGTFYDGTANVNVDNYSIGKYLVTQNLFKSVMGYNSSSHTGDLNLPVETLTFFDAAEFCNRLSALEGKETVYTITNATYSSNHITSATVTADWSKTGYRLPTEMEYEWAAMGGTSDACSGDIVNNIDVSGYKKGYAGSVEANGAKTNIENYAWLQENSSSTTHPVGLKTANELGLFDMTGNVWEWTWSLDEAYPTAVTYNPVGYASLVGSDNTRTGDSTIILRGGTYEQPITNCSLDSRGEATSLTDNVDHGLRLVCSAAPRYQIIYDSNDASSGTVPTDVNTYVSSESATILGNTGSLAVSGEIFSGWNTQSNGTGVGYSVGSTLSVNSNCTLYAQFVPLTVNTPQLTVTLSSTSSEVSWGDNVTFTANVTVSSGSASSYTYAWYVDGVSFGSNSSSLTILSSNLSRGSHTVNVIVTASGMSFSPASASTLTIN